MHKLSMLAITAVTTGVIGATGVDVANAATTTSNDKITGAVLKIERQAAAAKVLNTDTATIEAAHKNHTMKDLVTKAGLTRQSFHEKLVAQEKTDLKAKGYSDEQITTALQRHRIHHLKHELKKERANKH